MIDMYGFFASLRMTTKRNPVILSEAKELCITITSSIFLFLLKMPPVLPFP